MPIRVTSSSGRPEGNNEAERPGYLPSLNLEAGALSRVVRGNGINQG
jgi:hypothetical protein